MPRTPLTRHGPARAGAAVPRRGRERGVEALQVAALAGPLIVIVFGVLQGALYWVAALQAQAAAQAGVEAARVETGTVSAGTAAAQSTVEAIGVARQVRVTGSRTATDVTITVTAASPELIPVLPLPVITATSHGVVERVTR